MNKILKVLFPFLLALSCNSVTKPSSSNTKDVITEVDKEDHTFNIYYLSKKDNLACWHSCTYQNPGGSVQCPKAALIDLSDRNIEEMKAAYTKKSINHAGVEWDSTALDKILDEIAKDIKAEKRIYYADHSKRTEVFADLQKQTSLSEANNKSVISICRDEADLSSSFDETSEAPVMRKRSMLRYLNVVNKSDYTINVTMDYILGKKYFFKLGPGEGTYSETRPKIKIGNFKVTLYANVAGRYSIFSEWQPVTFDLKKSDTFPIEGPAVETFELQNNDGNHEIVRLSKNAE